jgi:hypothetical protein
MLKIDGHDDAVIGSATPWSNHTRVEVLVYDGNKIVEKLVSEGMTQEEAFEFVEFNIEGASVGEETPIIVWPGDINDYP